MGQYYRAVFIKENRPTHYVSPYDLGNLSKLMEHSFVENTFVRFVENLLQKPRKLVWAGDYGPKLKLTKKEIDELHVPNNKYGDKTYLTNNGLELYDLCELKSCKKVTPKYKYDWEFVGNNEELSTKRDKYIINHTKGLFVNKDKVPSSPNHWDFQIHPLPILTCDNNGAGGSLYSDSDLVGTWCGNLIQIVSNKKMIPKGFTELKFNIT